MNGLPQKTYVGILNPGTCECFLFRNRIFADVGMMSYRSNDGSPSKETEIWRWTHREGRRSQEDGQRDWSGWCVYKPTDTKHWQPPAGTHPRSEGFYPELQRDALILGCRPPALRENESLCLKPPRWRRPVRAAPSQTHVRSRPRITAAQYGEEPPSK